MNYLKDVLQLEQHFYQLGSRLFSELKPQESLTLNLSGENSSFIRFNRAKVRQTTHVEQAVLELEFQKYSRKLNYTVALQGDPDKDWASTLEAVTDMRERAKTAPEDPYSIAISNHGQSRQHFEGRMLEVDESIHQVTEAARGQDFVGYLSQGPLIRGNLNSLGQKHWFSTETFNLDYSLFNEKKKAVKATFAGREWDQEAFRTQLAKNVEQLGLMNRDEKQVPRGKYRVYLAPAAVADILGTMTGWGGLSFDAKKRGDSLFAKHEIGEEHFSDKFTLHENYNLGLSPRFNDLGEVSDEVVSLIEKGRLKELLTSSRSAKEYGVAGNNAGPEEIPKSPELLAGQIDVADIMAQLETGLYLSNLHYINFSDKTGGRITGMTRFACFWVEKGEIVAPIADLRFDESLFHCFGKNLVGLTSTQEDFPATSTYFQREVWGARMPGALVDDFTFTL